MYANNISVSKRRRRYKVQIASSQSTTDPVLKKYRVDSAFVISNKAARTGISPKSPQNVFTCIRIQVAVFIFIFVFPVGRVDDGGGCCPCLSAAVGRGRREQNALVRERRSGRYLSRLGRSPPTFPIERCQRRTNWLFLYIVNQHNNRTESAEFRKYKYKTFQGKHWSYFQRITQKGIHHCS